MRADAASPDFDEFSLLEDYARYEGLPWRGRPQVERRFVDVGGGQLLSALCWGDGDPQLVFLHGGGQNAHTWDSVVMALGRPAVAIDLPGHGHSSWRDDRDYWPWANAEAVATAMQRLAPSPRAVVGMSLGGLTTIRLAAEHRDLVERAVIVDVTPGVGQNLPGMTDEQRGSTQLTRGPRTFASFEDLVDATAKASGRDAEGAWRGARLNARPMEDGSWGWRYDQLRRPDDGPVDFVALWDDVSRIDRPLMLVRGGVSAHVQDGDVEEFRRRQAGLRVEVVDGAGHSVQGAKPLVLAALVDDFVFA
jgi:pimeloyl-ACP methyl ester carboxylesterase